MTRSIAIVTAWAVLALGAFSTAQGAGTLTPKGDGAAPIEIRNHQVRVVINNGFSMTEVQQTFFNPNDRDLEALYSFPLPKNASLSEVTVYAEEKQIHGEVVEKKRATEVYRKEREKGRDAALAQKNSFYSFDFAVSPMRAGQETQIRFVYYQPLKIDTGVGRYVYPLEEGGTDQAALSFWDTNTTVNGSFSFQLELKSAAPVAEVRMPGFQGLADVNEIGEDHYKVAMTLPDAPLERDVVFYYRLQEDLPGRIEVIPYRPDRDSAGTFMLVATPGLDLQPLKRGADYVFVLDVSGSMRGKNRTLARGVAKALGEMQPEDRIRIVVFNSAARELTHGWVPASRENVERLIQEVENLQVGGRTNVYAGLDLALQDLDDDRTASVVLVTDGVTNTGVLDARAFHQLLKQYDVRVFGFLMGNSANWPLMRTITEASGGFYAGVSNADDIVGQIILAKSKITHECLHDARLEISGTQVFDVTNKSLGKVYRGEQLVMFGRYDSGGQARVTLKARLSEEDKTYSTTFDFPDIELDNPEIERLWALAQIEEIETSTHIGDVEEAEAETAIRDLGVAYQLVTDYTSMVVLADDIFADYGIERRNRTRVARERQAQMRRSQQPARKWRVDQSSPAFPKRAPRTGGGAIDPVSAGLAFGLAALVIARRVRRRGR